MKKRRQIKLVFGWVATMMLLFAVPAAGAFEAVIAESLVIEADEVIPEDFYFNGESLVVHGTIQGDLFFAGTSLELSSTSVVDGDVIAGGNLIVIDGVINDDIIAGSSAMFLNENALIAGDVLVGGFGVELAAGSTVEGDLLIGAQSVIMSGHVGGNVDGGGGGVEIGGTIGGDVNIEFGLEEDALPYDPAMFNPNLPAETPRLPLGLFIEDGASIEGDFTYLSTRPIDIPDSLVTGAVSHVPREEPVVETGAARIFSSLWQGIQRWIVIVLLGWLALRFAPSLVMRPVALLSENVRGGLVRGALAYFLWIPLLALAVGLLIGVGVLFGVLSLGGLGRIIVGVGLTLLAIDVALIILTLLFVAYIWVGWLLGNTVMANEARPLIPLAIGTLILIILGALPFIGAIVSIGVGIVGLGMLWLWWRDWRRPQEKAPAAA